MIQRERFHSQTPSAGSALIAHILRNVYMEIADADLRSAGLRR